MPNLSSLTTNFFPTPNEGFTTSTSGPVDSSSATVVPLNSVSGLTNGAVFTGLIDPGNAKERAFTGLVDTGGSQITSVKFTTGSSATHTTGATVVDYVTGTHVGAISKGITQEHSQSGAHTNITQADANYIKDDAGNELLKWSKTTSAVNEITIKNAATGTDPRISASGGDSAVNLNLRGKGLAKTVTIGAGATTIYPYDYVASGCVLSGDSYGSTLNYSMTSGVVVINGNPVTVASFSATAATASRDTYVDVLDNGDGTGLVVNTGGNVVTNNAASPALASNSIRIGIVVSGAGSIASVASINQGQENKLLPIASSIPYQVTDSLGNLICPRDPHRKTLGQRQIVSAFSGTTTGGSGDDVTGLSTIFIADGVKKVKIVVGGSSIRSSAGAAQTVKVRALESSTELFTLTQQINTNGYNLNPCFTTPAFTPSAGTHTYKVNLLQSAAGTQTLDCSSTSPAFIRVEQA